MEGRKRKQGLLMATPAEEAEATRQLRAGRGRVVRDIVRVLEMLNEEVAHHRYRKALSIVRCLGERLIEFECYT